MPDRKIEMPKKIVEFNLSGAAKWLKRMGQTTVFICKIEWSWSAYNERMESYFLERDRTHWILWREPYDDNLRRWEKPVAIARCRQYEPDLDKDIAMTLLAAVLREEIRHYDSDPGPFGVTEGGLLSSEELKAVADAVYVRKI